MGKDDKKKGDAASERNTVKRLDVIRQAGVTEADLFAKPALLAREVAGQKLTVTGAKLGRGIEDDFVQLFVLTADNVDCTTDLDASDNNLKLVAFFEKNPTKKVTNAMLAKHGRSYYLTVYRETESK